MSYSQEKKIPKFLMQMNKNEQIPKLISIHDKSPLKREIRNKLLQNAIHKTTTKKCKTPIQQLVQIKQNLQTQRTQNQQLKFLIRELTVKSDKLREMNQHLINRIKQVEKSYRHLRSTLEQQYLQNIRKLKCYIYKDIEEYIKHSIYHFTEKLRQEKMTHRLEEKVQLFLAELMEINSISVQKMGKKQRLQNMEEEKNHLAKNINQILQKQFRSQSKYVSDLNNSPLPSQQQYASIIQSLTGDPKTSDRVTNSYVGDTVGHRLTSVSKYYNIRNEYATTPQKRRKIFD